MLTFCFHGSNAERAKRYRQTVRQWSIYTSHTLFKTRDVPSLCMVHIFNGKSCGRTSFFIKGPLCVAGNSFKVTACPQTRLSLQNSKRVILLRWCLLRGLCKGARLRRHMLETRLHPQWENTTESTRTATAVLVSWPHRAISRVKAMGEVIKIALKS